MTANKLKKALKDFESFADFEATELKEMIINSDYSASEADEIIEKLKTGAKVEKFELSDLLPTIAYDEDGDEVLTASEKWKKYNEFETKVLGTKMIEFIKVNASPVFKEKKGVQRLIGLRMEKDKPLQSTFITARNARLMNEQIYNTNTLQTGRFYYLIAEHFNY